MTYRCDHKVPNFEFFHTVQIENVYIIDKSIISVKKKTDCLFFLKLK